MFQLLNFSFRTVLMSELYSIISIFFSITIAITITIASLPAPILALTIITLTIAEIALISSWEEVTCKNLYLLGVRRLRNFYVALYNEMYEYIH